MSLKEMAFHLGLNTSKFDRNMFKTQRELKKLAAIRLVGLQKELREMNKTGETSGKRFREITREVADVRRAMHEAGGSANVLSKALKNVGLSWGSAFKIGVASKALDGLIGLAKSFGSTIAKQFSDSFQSNLSNENALTTFFSLTGGNKNLAQGIVNMLRKEAMNKGLDTESTLAAGRSLFTSAGNDPRKMMKLVQIAERLAVLNPDKNSGGGLDGAAFALKEAEADDYLSLRERFNIGRSELQGLKDKGFRGADLVDQLLKAKNIGDQAVVNQSRTVSGTITYIRSFMMEFKRVLGEGLFKQIGGVLAKVADWIRNNSTMIFDVARGISTWIGDAFGTMMNYVKSLEPVVMPLINQLRDVVSHFFDSGKAGNMFTGFLTGLINTVKWIVGLIQSIDFNNLWASLWQITKDIASMLFDVLVTAGDAIGKKIVESLPTILGGGKTSEQKKLDKMWEMFGGMTNEERSSKLKELQAQPDKSVISDVIRDTQIKGLQDVMAGNRIAMDRGINDVIREHATTINQRKKGFYTPISQVPQSQDMFAYAQMTGQMHRMQEEQATALALANAPRAPEQKRQANKKEEEFARRQNLKNAQQKVRVVFTSLDGKINPISAMVS